MRKMLLALSLLGLFSTAHAGDFKDGYSISTGINNYSTSSGDSSTGYQVGASYTKYLNNNVFVQPSIHYVDSQNPYGDKQMLGFVDFGYTFKLANNMTLSPKAGLGFHHTIANDSSDTKIAYNAGVELGFAKNWSLSLEKNYLQGPNGKHVDITFLSIAYKF